MALLIAVFAALVPCAASGGAGVVAPLPAIPANAMISNLTSDELVSNAGSDYMTENT